jgi:hypothetical protein
MGSGLDRERATTRVFLMWVLLRRSVWISLCPGEKVSELYVWGCLTLLLASGALKKKWLKPSNYGLLGVFNTPRQSKVFQSQLAEVASPILFSVGSKLLCIENLYS